MRPKSNNNHRRFPAGSQLPGTAQQLYGLYETWYDYDATDPAQVRRHDSMINQNLADAKRQAQTILEQFLNGIHYGE